MQLLFVNRRDDRVSIFPQKSRSLEIKQIRYLSLRKVVWFCLPRLSQFIRSVDRNSFEEMSRITHIKRQNHGENGKEPALYDVGTLFFWVQFLFPFSDQVFICYLRTMGIVS